MEPKLASLTLLPARLVPNGPYELVLKVQTILSQTADPFEEQRQLDALYREWYVLCSVSGEKILISDLLYWDVERKRVYARPELIQQDVPVPAK